MPVKNAEPATRIVISGYYGFHNLGDEAVLYSMLDALKKEWLRRRKRNNSASNCLQIVVLSNASGQTKNLYATEAVNRWQIKEVFRALRGADLLISGGGSLLQDVTGVKSLLYYLGIVWLALKLKKPVVFYAQGIGPVRTLLGRFLVRKIANQVKLIIVRDEHSAKDLAEMGINRPPVHVTVDSALALSGRGIDLQVGREILARFGVGVFPADGSLATPKIAGISVRRWPGFLKKERQVVARVGDRLTREGWQVVFLPFHYPDDVSICRDIAAMMKKPAPTLEMDFTVEEMTGVIKCLDLLIGMRLHALILSAILCVPLVGLSYDPKIGRFLNQLGIKPAAEVENLDFVKLNGAVEEVLSDPEGFKRKLEEKIKPLQDLAHQSAILTLGIISTDEHGEEY